MQTRRSHRKPQLYQELPLFVFPCFNLLDTEITERNLPASHQQQSTHKRASFSELYCDLEGRREIKHREDHKDAIPKAEILIESHFIVLLKSTLST